MLACRSQKAKLSYAFHFTEMPCYGKHCEHEWKPLLTARPMQENLPKEKEKDIGSILLAFFYTVNYLATFRLFDEKQNPAHPGKQQAFYAYFHFRRHVVLQSSVQTPLSLLAKSHHSPSMVQNLYYHLQNLVFRPYEATQQNRIQIWQKELEQIFLVAIN